VILPRATEVGGWEAGGFEDRPSQGDYKCDQT
jgi:hypothetical protein